MSTQADILRKRYAALRKQGTTDMKFVFAGLRGETVESVCGSVNEFLDAVQHGEYDDCPELDSEPR